VDRFIGMTLAELNAMDVEPFREALGWIFEDSPWVAERAWGSAPFESVEELRGAMVGVVRSAGRLEQLALLRAHPDLGTRVRLSAASEGEQVGAGLDSLTVAEYGALVRWNAEYRERFGFPFIFAVRGSSKYDVLRALESRVGSRPEVEFGVALEEVYKIAGFRLGEFVSG
jgi:2-oxo-4-hydroxy-4-carboxy-5-ureidoimidazoline decarboxylase